MAAESTLRGIMTKAMKTLGPNQTSVADDLMKQDHLRHIAVLDDHGGLCGIVSQRDLFRGALLRFPGYG